MSCLGTTEGCTDFAGLTIGIYTLFCMQGDSTAVWVRSISLLEGTALVILELSTSHQYLTCACGSGPIYPPFVASLFHL